MRRSLKAKLVHLVKLPPAERRRASLRLAGRVLRDDRGGEVLEYALIAGLMVVGAIGAISCVGVKVLNRWNSINDGI